MKSKSTEHAAVSTDRRKLLTATTKGLTGAALMALVDPLVKAGAWAAGSDAPEKPDLKLGFIPLTDCASVVMASEMGFDKKHGLKITS